MLHQIPSFPKPRLQAMAAVLLAGALAFCASPADAFVRISDQTANAALIYGMKNAGMGKATLLGPNWVEGDKGSLLVIYSPFMMIAAKAAAGGYTHSPTEKDLKAARSKYAKYIYAYTDPKRANEVKFSVNFFGDDPSFAARYSARIEGFGRGKQFLLKPARSFAAERAEVYGQAENDKIDRLNNFEKSEKAKKDEKSVVDPLATPVKKTELTEEELSALTKAERKQLKLTQKAEEEAEKARLEALELEAKVKRQTEFQAQQERINHALASSKAAKEEKKAREKAEAKARKEAEKRGEQYVPTPYVGADSDKGKTGAYVAVNTYYFRLADVQDLQDFRLILESPGGPKYVFRLKGEVLY